MTLCLEVTLPRIYARVVNSSLKKFRNFYPNFPFNSNLSIFIGEELAVQNIKILAFYPVIFTETPRTPGCWH